MRQFRLFAIIMAITTITAFTSCKRTDPIHGVPSVTSAFYMNAYGEENFPLNQFYELGQNGDTISQHQFVNQYRKELTANVVREYPKISDEKNIHFILGSGFAKNVKSGNGKTYSGRFKNELIIIVNDPEIQDTVFLACGNSTLMPLKFDDYHDFGTAEQWKYTILPGHGLTHHLPQLKTWVEIADDISIPIKDSEGKVVSKENYLNYLERYQHLLFPYDIIDILNCKVYNKDNQEVNFEQRLTETEKANAEIAEAIAKRQPRARLKRNRKR